MNCVPLQAICEVNRPRRGHRRSIDRLPVEADILQPGEPAVPVLEVPDNGILVDYVSTEEMIEIFEANWPGEVLMQPTQFSIGFHPSNFHAGYQRTISRTLDHVDQFLASRGSGPVVYSTLSDTVKVWPR